MPVTLNMIPATLQEFQTCPQMDLSKPENTCAMFLCALQLYIKDRGASRSLGFQVGALCASCRSGLRGCLP